MVPDGHENSQQGDARPSTVEIISDVNQALDGNDREPMELWMDEWMGKHKSCGS